MNKALVASLACLITATPSASAKNIPLEQATITRIINDVRVLDPKKGTAPAQVTQVIKDDMGVKTGVKSRAELLFQDNTLTRLGAESYFTFCPGTREMSLDSGTLLLQVPKDHGGATIRAASITASITGTTIMIENIPNKSLKVLVLEGSLRVSRNGRFGEVLSLKAGKMMILQPGAKNLPDPVNVDLRGVIKTSSLVNPELFSDSAANRPAPLPSMPLIADAIASQEKLRSAGQLQDTNLVILGKGNTVVTASEQIVNALVAASVPVGSTSGSGTDGQNSAASQAAANGTSGSSPSGTTGSSTAAAGTSSAGSSSSSASAGSLAPGSASSSTSSALQTISSVASVNAAATTAAATTTTTPAVVTPPPAASNGAVTSLGTAAAPYAGNVNISAPVLQTSGTIAAGGAPSGAGGGYSVYATGNIVVTSPIQVSSNSPTQMSASGGTIHLESLQTGTGGNAINITNTGQLLSLLNSAAPGPGGRIEFVSAGPKITIGGTVQADRGTITVDQNGAGGQIIINGATMAANVIAIKAVQSNGVLDIGNSHLTANTLLQLYGGSGTGGVYFTQNTLLDGTGLKLIAGKEVSIANSKVVTLAGGLTTVFTDKPSYSSASGGNGTTSGQFQLQSNPGTAVKPLLLPFILRP